jgi:hypothetical protein
MLLPALPLIFRRRASRAAAARRVPPAPPPPPLALALVAATYDEVNLQLVLTFDRAVDLAGFDGSAFMVGDPTFNHTAYDGTGGPPSLDAPAIVRVYLNPTGPYFSTEVDLEVSGASGIVAVDDGGTWPGTPGLIFLPYP